MRPVMVDLCCGAGGATRGYQAAGFHVVGVDIAPQPNYCGDEFIQMDAVAWLMDYVYERRGHVDAVHVSPPCQRFSDLAHRNGNAHEWPDLVDSFRSLLRQSGLPYVIENVEGAPLRNPVTLCGTMFPGLRVIRHRLFESNMPLAAMAHGRHPLVFTHDKRKAHYGKLDQDTAFVQVTGGGNATLANKLDAMGIDWMRSHQEVNEAIPPAYTEFIGAQLMQHVRAAA